jgi:hypothetical protein
MGSDITNKENILTFVDPSLKSSLCVTIDDNINNQSYESIASVLPQIIPNIRTVDKAKEAVIKKTLVVFKIKNPTQYLVSIKGISRQELLVLNEKYNSEWVVFGDKGGFLNKKLVSNGTLHKGSVLMSGDVEYKNYSSWLNNEAIKNTSHILANGYANGWIVDPVMVCKESPQSCTKNPDGSYDISLIIEFWPQRLFYLGLFISGTTLFGLTGYSVYTWYKESKINRKKNENYKNQ